jgi:hypothetical protein
MTEAECYARCYGGGPVLVEVIRRPRLVATLSVEQIRLQFEQRLDSREREAA